MELSDKQKAAYLKKLGQKIESLIYSKYKSKDEFLRETGIFKKGLHDILTGKRDARISTYLRIAVALGVKLEEILPVE